MKTKDEFIRRLADSTGLTLTDSRTAWDGFRDIIVEALIREEKVILPEMGYLELKHRAAKKGRNPQTGEEITISAKNAVVFRMIKKLKEEVNPKKKRK